MSPTTGEERRRRLRELRGREARDKARLIFLGVLLVVVLAAYFLAGRARRRPEPPPAPPLASEIALPPVDHEALARVDDSTDEARLLLETEAYRDLLEVARALLPAHLDALDEPTLPFAELPAAASELRGRPFRVRGEIRNLRRLKRPPSLTEETWAWLRTDDGHDVFLASLGAADAGLEAGDYAVADGFFFKLYSQSIDGRRVDAPLLVGPRLRASVRKAPPVTEVDPLLLAEVEDDPLGTDRPLHTAGKWHLLGLAATLAADPERREAFFAGAPELDYQLLGDLARNPAAYRGKAFLIPGRVPQEPRFSGSMPAGENPLRCRRLWFGWLGNPLVLGQNPIHLISSDAFPIDQDGARIYLGIFFQLKGYQDKEDNWRRAPVFVVAGARPAPREPNLLVQNFTWAVLVAAIVLAGLVAWLARRDRLRAEQAAAELRERRRRRRQAEERGG
ncbi:MAG: hypothetical protein D6702_08235 [Planctomycetota bacterium]|nr:MAG: hypothetical protein D6702_08235 [Planctomycetota bacterium]